jgi:hypothetical protein
MAQYTRIYWISADTPGKAVVEPINYERYTNLLSANLIRVVPDDSTSKQKNSDVPVEDAGTSATQAQIEALYQVNEFYAGEFDDDEQFGDTEEQMNKPDSEVFPEWWAQKKPRPEIIVVPNPNVPDGVMLLIKRHFSEAIEPLKGNHAASNFFTSTHQLPLACT